MRIALQPEKVLARMAISMHRNAVAVTVLLLAIFVVSLSVLPKACHGAAADEVGEFSIGRTVLLTADQLASLRQLVGSDAGAAGMLATLGKRTERILNSVPMPLRAIDYEGLVNTDPRRIASVEKLKQMGDVSVALCYWQATADAATEAWLRQIIVAWAETYQPTGNDVNENKLYPLMVAYGSLRNQFATAEQEHIDQWLRTIAKPHHDAVTRADKPTNRYTKSVRILAVIGRILGRSEWVDSAAEGLQNYVAKGLRPDGTSLDLERRDSLTYHASGLRPMVEMAMMFPDRNLYHWESSEGASIQKSVNYLVPFVDGTQTHLEWVHTTIELDRRRAAAGLEEYRTGRLYEPADALPLFREAAIFDPALMELVRQVESGTAGVYEDWTSVVNAAVVADGHGW